jgi:antitoxin component YwqK of YwqJK toxin-antitoxin module
MMYVIEMAWVDEKMEERFSGVNEVYHHINGKLIRRTYWKDGLRNGVEETFYYLMNGVLESKVEWVLGRKEGLEEVFYEDGGLWKWIRWKKGLLHGKEEWFEKGSGKIIKLIKWVEGKKHGKSVDYLFPAKEWYWMDELVSKVEWERREMERAVGLELE